MAPCDKDSTHTHAHTHTHTHTHTHAHTLTHAHTHTACMYMCIYNVQFVRSLFPKSRSYNVHVHVHTCIYAHTYTYRWYSMCIHSITASIIDLPSWQHGRQSSSSELWQSFSLEGLNYQECWRSKIHQNSPLLTPLTNCVTHTHVYTCTCKTKVRVYMHMYIHVHVYSAMCMYLCRGDTKVCLQGDSSSVMHSLRYVLVMESDLIRNLYHSMEQYTIIISSNSGLP